MTSSKRYLILLASFALSMAGLLGVLGLAWPARALDLPTPPCPPPDGRALPGSLRAACADESVPEFRAAPAAPIPSGSKDDFGYTLYDDQVFAWMDITTGTKAIVSAGPGTPNVVAGPYALGFTFKFYENQYTQVYISDNGLLGFDSSIQGSGVSQNQNIPNDYESPQNIIAPFWDNLVVDEASYGSAVYYAKGSQAGKKFFAVEWYQVDSLKRYDDLTFEVILYEDGDIVFQYDVLDGPTDDATVGIEDSYGMDGLQYLYNSEGLEVDKDIKFDRPDPSRRVKISPTYQGGFNINGQSSFQVLVRNTGDVGLNDAFTLTASLSDPAWGADLRAQDGQAAANTGTLAEGGIFTLTVDLSAPAEAEAGDQVTVTLTATSTENTSKSALARLVSAVPAPFGLIYRQGQPLWAQFVSPFAQYDAVVEKYYFAQAFALSNILEGDYISVWESNNRIRYFLLNGAGVTYFDEARDLTSGSGTDIVYTDLSPVVETAPNGTIGVAWVRSKLDLSTFPPVYNDNVYFARLDQEGEKIGGEIDVSGIISWTLSEDTITFNNIRILATQDNTFHLGWVQTDPGGATDIGHAVYPSTGDTPDKPAELFTDGITGDDINYTSPALVSYGSEILLLYFSKDSTEPITPMEKIVYGEFETDGDPISGQTDLFTDTPGTGIDGVELNDGSLALAWTILGEGKVAVAVIDNLASPGAPMEFTNPDGRSASTVSITGSQAGKAILTWIDGDFKKRMYYALVDHDHGVLTWPMTFKYVTLGGSSLETSLGWGNASYIPMFRVSLPLVHR
ncbi:MAG: hypothetical protein JXA78_10120 [Anaerolineales bacterium]|nr:hypothetical protein [Anaerolineales bacterium]